MQSTKQAGRTTSDIQKMQTYFSQSKQEGGFLQTVTTEIHNPVGKSRQTNQGVK